MGAILSLSIKNMEIDWGKNSSYNNHSILFQENDMDVELDSYGLDKSTEGEFQNINEIGASKPLYQVKDRLDLLGFSLSEIEAKYNNLVEEFLFNTGDQFEISYKEFFWLIVNLDVNKVNTIEYFLILNQQDFDFDQYFNFVIEKESLLTSKFKTIKNKIKKTSNFPDFFEKLNPYVILRILCENKKNLNYNVEWKYQEAVESGWIKRENIEPRVADENKILIVTEGNTDSLIIKKTLVELYPHISDLFYFIDMKKGYPYTGAGNLKQFAKGLSKINMQNNAIIIFDNDTVGLEMYNAIKSNIKLKNMILCVLPNLDDFNNFKCIGPDGEENCNINGKGVAIECFLDLNKIEGDPKIKWKNFNDNLKSRHGVLENKNKHIKMFFKYNLKEGEYNTTKLELLIKHLISCWINR